MIAVSLNAAVASTLSNWQNCACARKKHYKHEDGRMAPCVCGNGSVPLSHSGNVVTRIGIHTHTFDTSNLWQTKKTVLIRLSDLGLKISLIRAV